MTKYDKKKCNDQKEDEMCTAVLATQNNTHGPNEQLLIKETMAKAPQMNHRELRNPNNLDNANKTDLTILACTGRHRKGYLSTSHQLSFHYP